MTRTARFQDCTIQPSWDSHSLDRQWRLEWPAFAQPRRMGHKDTEDWAIVQAGDTKGDTGSIPGQANGAAGISKSPSFWYESVLAPLWYTDLSPSFICPAWAWNRDVAWRMAMPVDSGSSLPKNTSLRVARLHHDGCRMPANHHLLHVKNRLP